MSNNGADKIIENYVRAAYADAKAQALMNKLSGDITRTVNDYNEDIFLALEPLMEVYNKSPGAEIALVRLTESIKEGWESK